MKQLFLITGIALTVGQASAQTWSYPPQTFTGSTNICDGTPYKLVFSDDFNGTTLSPPWNRFMSWAGMPGGDNDNWPDSRLGGEPRNGIYRDKNVVVNDGAVHLKVYKERGAWKCGSCPDSFRANYSYGCITLPYNNASGQDIGYDNGKFEARIQFPVFKNFWGTFWLWHAGINVNELDIAEAVGPNGSWPYIGSRHAKVSDNLHAWIDEGLHQPNPYGLPANASTGVAYPNQSWADFLRGVAFKQEDWHTYTSEWDSTFIKTYLDGELVNTVWKYYRDLYYSYWTGSFWMTYLVRQPSECVPASGTWKVTYGFPYHKTSDCQLRFTTAIYGSDPPDMTGYTSPVYLGSMNIDYVKIWQRHPEANNHQDICAVTGSLLGPDTICNTATYTLPAGIPTGGTWSLSNGHIFFNSTGSNSCSVTTSSSRFGHSNSTTIIYTFTSPIPGCGIQTISKTVLLNNIVGSIPVFCTRVSTGHAPGTIHLNLQAGRTIPGATYEWTINYGPNSSSLSTYHVFGRTVSTPPFISSGIGYYATWTLKIYNSCMGKIITGSSSSAGFSGMRPLTQIFNQDSSVVSVDVRFNTPSDTAAYEQAVYNRVAQQFVANVSDTSAIKEMISNIRFEELAPYVVFGQSPQSQLKPNPEQGGLAQENVTVIYPNPASGQINIAPGALYRIGEPILLSVFDMSGGMVRSVKVAYSGSPMPLSLTGLPDALYSLEIKQSGQVEHHKITKAGDR